MEHLTFVSCVNKAEVAKSCLLASPCLAPGRGHQLILVSGMPSAGAGARWGAKLARHPWMVLLHQDVYLPEGWDVQFLAGLRAASREFPALAVAGVYGVRADGSHAGHVYDRDCWLGSPLEAAERVRSLDELLLAVRLDSGIGPDPALGWHLYGTDVCLQAEAAGLDAVVLHAPCEHRASLVREVASLNAEEKAQWQPGVDAFNASVETFCKRWSQALPVVTPMASVDEGYRLSI